ncbi:MAG: HAD family hydrolase, partial [Verrucomicrobiota bacterium]
KNLKILCTDFDGTLLDHDDGGSPPPAEFFEMLYAARQKGDVTWVINTGRGWNDLKHELISKAFPVWPDWVVLVERHIYRLVDREPVEHWEWNDRCREIHLDLFGKTKSLFEEIRTYLQTHTEADLINDSASPLGIVAKSPDEANRIASYLDDRLGAYADLVYVRNSIWFRFSHIHFNKGTCLQEIAKHHEVTPDEILAAGDHWNDLSMLDSQFARGIVCPSNSEDLVKAQVLKHSGYIAQGKAGHGVLEGWKHFFPKKI